MTENQGDFSWCSVNLELTGTRGATVLRLTIGLGIVSLRVEHNRDLLKEAADP